MCLRFPLAGRMLFSFLSVWYRWWLTPLPLVLAFRLTCQFVLHEHVCCMSLYSVSCMIVKCMQRIEYLYTIYRYTISPVSTNSKAIVLLVCSWSQCIVLFGTVTVFSIVTSVCCADPGHVLPWFCLLVTHPSVPLCLQYVCSLKPQQGSITFQYSPPPLFSWVLLLTGGQVGKKSTC